LRVAESCARARNGSNKAERKGRSPAITCRWQTPTGHPLETDCSRSDSRSGCLRPANCGRCASRSNAVIDRRSSNEAGSLAVPMRSVDDAGPVPDRSVRRRLQVQGDAFAGELQSGTKRSSERRRKGGTPLNRIVMCTPISLVPATVPGGSDRQSPSCRWSLRRQSRSSRRPGSLPRLGLDSPPGMSRP
jgi:hypothetical protein